MWRRRQERGLDIGRVQRLYSYGCAGNHGHGYIGRGFGPRQRSHTVKLAPGTPIFDEENGAAWAIVREEVEVTAVYADGDRWAQLVAIPGIDLGIADVYIRRE